MIADGLPKLGYLTLLDEYILVTFGFIAAVGQPARCSELSRHATPGAQLG